MDAKPILNINVVIDTSIINTYPSIDKNDFFVINIKKEIPSKTFTIKKRKREDLLVTNN